jgi:hypothetical protein
MQHWEESDEVEIITQQLLVGASSSAAIPPISVTVSLHDEAKDLEQSGRQALGVGVEQPLTLHKLAATPPHPLLSYKAVVGKVHMHLKEGTELTLPVEEERVKVSLVSALATALNVTTSPTHYRDKHH